VGGIRPSGVRTGYHEALVGVYVTQWTYADIWQSIARARPHAAALVQGERILSWRDFDVHINALSHYLLMSGLRRQSKVGAYFYNCPEYVCTVAAAMTAGLVPFNVNYRYSGDELLYLLDNADAEAIIFDRSFLGKLAQIRPRLPKIKSWIASGKDEAHGDLPDWAVSYEQIVRDAPRDEVSAPWGRSDDDILLIYTGGTTGMPKGVMWRQGDLLAYSRRTHPILSLPTIQTPDDIVAHVSALPHRVSLIASPLMHAVGQMGALAALAGGASVALLPSRRFDAEELWSEVARLRASRISLVGSAFCGPMLEALEAHPGRWDLSCVEYIGSSGAMWSFENKRGLLRHLPQASLNDSFSSSEAFGMGASISTRGNEAGTAKFVVGPECALFAEDGRRIPPGSNEAGLLAVGGYTPLGYYKDPVKTAKTFPIIDGKRWSMPGDWATVNADGTLNVLGRGSQCINTGGEKVFPEEVEEALKKHPAIRDAAVVGLPDPRFGQKVCAVVELRTDTAPPLPALAAFVHEHLADFKTPRALVIVPELGRAPNGKLDYKSLLKLAIERTRTA
jgi:acyl-CoA synthetase (AMP-forming)/AMP-acid ligase II